MSAVSAPRPGWELLAGQVNQRRYEALRAYLYQGLSLREAAEVTGYTPATQAQHPAGTRRQPAGESPVWRR